MTTPTTDALDRAAARKIIEGLKKGTTPLELAPHINIGNERWYAAAEEFYRDVEEDGECQLRFIKGYYGDGKTHFLANLRARALRRGWMVSYVSLETTPLHKFDEFYQTAVKNIVIPEGFAVPTWVSNGERRGLRAVLSAFFARWYAEENGSDSRAGLKTMEVPRRVQDRVKKVVAALKVPELVARAVHVYVQAALAENSTKMQNVVSWLEGQPITFPDLGLTRRLNAVLAPDFMRAVASIAKGAGIKGSLFLVDEAERIMNESERVRGKCYGLIRDLLDNADGQGGIPYSMIYVAATPEMFTGTEGFIENDALRSKLSHAQHLQIGNLIEWRSVVVDLLRTPMKADRLTLLGKRVREVHATAREWDPLPYIGDPMIHGLIERVERNATTQVSKPRVVSALIATILEVVEQNREHLPPEAVEETFHHVMQAMCRRPKEDSGLT